MTARESLHTPRRIGTGSTDPQAARNGEEATRLVEAAKRNEPGAFDALVRRYRPRIYALALHLSGSRADADDITQDAFVRAYHALPQFEGRSEFFTWLYRIALHQSLNAKRSQRRTTAVDPADPRIEAALRVDAPDDPLRAFELRETYASLVAALDRLSPLLRATVALVTMQGLSHKEAAVVLETNEGTVSWRIHEARKQMRLALEERARETATGRSSRERTEESPRQASADSLELAFALLH